MRASREVLNIIEASKAESDAAPIGSKRALFIARELESLMSRITDQAIARVEEDRRSPSKMFPAGKWNTYYTDWLEYLWPKMPPELQHAMVHRILTK